MIRRADSPHTSPTEALLTRFNAASEAALEALARGDQEALTKALDTREALQHELAYAVESELRARASAASLRALVHAAEELQASLESAATSARDRIAAEIAALDTAASATASYTSPLPDLAHRLDAVL